MTCCQTFLVNWIRRQIIIREGRHDKCRNHNRYECSRNADGKQCWIVNPYGSRKPLIATTAADTGLAVIPIWLATTAMDNGTDGLMFSLLPPLRLQES